MGKDLKGKELGKGMSQRKDGRYSFRYVDRFGKRVQIYDYDLRALKKQAKKIQAENELFLNSQEGNITINELYDLAEETILPNKLKETTIIKYRDVYNRYISKTLGNKKIKNVTMQDLQLFLVSLNNYSLATIKSVKTILKHCYDAAVFFEFKQSNPISTLYIKSNKNKKVVDSLTLEEQIMFENASKDSFYYNLYMLILNTGLRVGEAIALEFDDIDFEENVIHVRKQLLYNNLKGTFSNGNKFIFTSPKYDSIRDVPMNQTVKNILSNQVQFLEFIKQSKFQKNCKQFKEYPMFKNLIFISRTGTPIARAVITTDLKRIRNMINEMYGVQMNTFGIHVLRHTFATRCYEAKMEQKKLQIILGHKSLSTTNDIYVTRYLNGDETNILDNLYKESKIENRLNLN